MNETRRVMRIVFDTKSSRWRAFKRLVLFVFLWVVMFILSTIIGEHINWDPDFCQGFWSCALIWGYIEL